MAQDRPAPAPSLPPASAPPRAFPLPPRALVGMIHLAPLPGSPRAALSIDEIARRAAAEARLLAGAGFDALIVENMHDAPYINHHAPVVTAAMTAAALAVRAAAPALPLGVQVLSLGSLEALAIAVASGASFIRVENFVFAHVADEGLMPSAQAGPLLRERRRINAEHVAIFADIKKKHASHAITADVPLADAAHAAHFFGADAVIVSGAATGRPTDLADVARAKSASPLPVLVGSGVTPATLPATLHAADAAIVGSFYKLDGDWRNPPDPARAAALVAAARAARR